MRFLSTRAHGALDYVIGVLLIAAPWLFGFAANGAETWVPVALGVSIIVYSLLTNYERGATPVLSMRTHLWLDGLGGALLAASPWLFGFDELVQTPHLVVGILLVGLALVTRTATELDARRIPTGTVERPARANQMSGRG